MTSKLFVFLFISLGFVNGSFAAKVCAKNAKDLAQLKDSFPKFLQDKNEVSFAQTEGTTVAMRFLVTEDKVITQYKFKFFGTHGDVGYATEICYDKATRELSLKMDNGKDVTAKVTNDDPPHATVVAMKQTLTRNPAVYNEAIKILGGMSEPLRKTFEDSRKGAQ